MDTVFPCGLWEDLRLCFYQYVLCTHFLTAPNSFVLFQAGNKIRCSLRLPLWMKNCSSWYENNAGCKLKCCLSVSRSFSICPNCLYDFLFGTDGSEVNRHFIRAVLLGLLAKAFYLNFYVVSKLSITCLVWSLVELTLVQSDVFL